MSRRPTHPAVGIGAILLAAFCVTDCAVGSTHVDRGEVLGRFVTSSQECDEDGRNCHIDHDYVVLFDCGGQTHRTETTMYRWARLRDGQQVEITHRDGRWTGAHYIHILKPIGGESW